MIDPEQQLAGKQIVIYFQVHQPWRLNRFTFFDIGTSKGYFNDNLNASILRRVAANCYLPVNAVLLKILKTNPQVKLNFSISGSALDQFERYSPEVLASFRALIETGNVELFAETYYHSLASLISEEEFNAQVLEHVAQLDRHFGYHPSVFRNTEMIYNDKVGRVVSNLGFQGVVCEGIEKLMGRSPCYQVYCHPTESALKILLRHNRLSDDISFRFDSDKRKLSVAAYKGSIHHALKDSQTILLGMDYETFGEHRKKETGIIDFLKNLLTSLTSEGVTLAKATDTFKNTGEQPPLSIPNYTSWADENKDLSAWLGNDMQQEAFKEARLLAKEVKESSDHDLLHTWRSLLTSDHFYYMSTKGSADGKVHSYFSHYDTPYEAFINYMNVLKDLRMKATKQMEQAKLRASSDMEPAL